MTGEPTAADVEQVKPGAGMSAPEMKDVLPQIAASTAPSLSPPRSTSTYKEGSSNSGSSSSSFLGTRQKNLTSTTFEILAEAFGGILSQLGHSFKKRFIESHNFQNEEKASSEPLDVSINLTSGKPACVILNSI
ncbi:hypothetical protein BDZ97DRAFT_1760973 [Flammula alnicola]|nr:hypothetical protein BDZ97DRAFT_1760973 [Flammula alnicola]